MDVPYKRLDISGSTYDSARDPANQGGLGGGNFLKLDRDTGFCFDNQNDTDIRVLFEAFIPDYACVPDGQPASMIKAVSANVPDTTCQPPTSKTCSGAVARPGAMVRTVPIIDALGCGYSWTAFANDDADVRKCAQLAGFYPVAEACEFAVQLYPGFELDLWSDSVTDALRCAKLGPSGCANCDGIAVIAMGACLSGAR